MPTRKIDPLPDARQADIAASDAALTYVNASCTSADAMKIAFKAMFTNDPADIKAAQEAYQDAASAAIKVSEAAQVSANQAAHAASAFGMKGLTTA
jgi:hypothetical protein